MGRIKTLTRMLEGEAGKSGKAERKLNKLEGKTAARGAADFGSSLEQRKELFDSWNMAIVDHPELRHLDIKRAAESMPKDADAMEWLQKSIDEQYAAGILTEKPVLFDGSDLSGTPLSRVKKKGQRSMEEVADEPMAEERMDEFIKKYSK